VLVLYMPALLVDVQPGCTISRHTVLRPTWQVLSLKHRPSLLVVVAVVVVVVVVVVVAARAPKLPWTQTSGANNQVMPSAYLIPPGEGVPAVAIIKRLVVGMRGGRRQQACPRSRSASLWLASWPHAMQ